MCCIARIFQCKAASVWKCARRLRNKCSKHKYFIDFWTSSSLSLSFLVGGCRCSWLSIRTASFPALALVLVGERRSSCIDYQDVVVRNKLDVSSSQGFFFSFSYFHHPAFPSISLFINIPTVPLMLWLGTCVAQCGAVAQCYLLISF